MNDFFKQLRQEMEGNPYQDRFLEELQEHAEDLKEDKSSKKSLISDDMKKHFGDPKQIKKDFVAITRPGDKWLAGMEALVYGFLLAPLFYFWIRAMGSIHNLFEAPSSFPISVFLQSYLFGIGVILVSFLAYFFLFRRWRIIRSLIEFPKMVWIGLALLPTFILFGVIYANFSSGDYFFMANLPPIALAGNLCVAFFAHYLSCKKFKFSGSVAKKESKSSFLSKLAWPFIIYIFLFSFVRTFLLGSAPSIFLALFYPVLHLEYSLFFVLSAWTGQSLNFIWVVGAIVAFIVLQSIFSMFYHRRWSWGRGALIFYVFSLLLIPGDFFEGKFDFQVPAHSVSATLEKSQLGPMYGFAKYTNADEGEFFRYEINQKDGFFGLWQNTGTRFYFDPEQWISKKTGAIVQKEPTEIVYSGSYASTWPKELACQHDERDRTQELAHSTRCHQVLYKGVVLLPRRGFEYDVQDLALSEDQDWLLMVLGTGAYDPHEVYLLNLNSLNQ